MRGGTCASAGASAGLALTVPLEGRLSEGLPAVGALSPPAVDSSPPALALGSTNIGTGDAVSGGTGVKEGNIWAGATALGLEGVGGSGVRSNGAEAQIPTTEYHLLPHARDKAWAADPHLQQPLGLVPPRLPDQTDPQRFSAAGFGRFAPPEAGL